MQIAKLLSEIFLPLYAPLWAFAGIFVFSYLKMLPLGYKIQVMLLVMVFCVIIPHAGINIFRMLMKWTHLQLSHREHRHMPYILTLMSYGACLIIMTQKNMILPLKGIVLTSLIAQIACVIINAWWKISIHAVGMGGLLGTLMSFCILFSHNPFWPFCGIMLVSGAVGTSRIILRQNTLSQVIVGFVLGYVIAMTFITISWL